MYFQFKCPKCEKSLKVREENVGSKVRCPYCQNQTVVKAPAPVDPWDVDEDESDEELDFDPHAPMKGSAGKKKSVKKNKPIKKKETTPAPQGDAHHHQKTDSTEVSTGLSAIIGLGGFALFYLIVGPLALWKGKGEFYLVDLFCYRGWVQYALVFLTMWSLAILFLKYKKLNRQKNSMFFDLLPN